MSVLVLLEFELLLLPNLLNLEDVNFDLRLLLGPVDELVDLLSELVQLKLDQIIEAEARCVEVDRALCDAHQLLPVALLHELRVEHRDQGKDGVHVLHTIVDGDEGPPVLNVLILGVLRVGLLGLNVLDELHEILGVDLVPKSRFPRVELQINKGNQIPHVLELLELVLAVLELLVG